MAITAWSAKVVTSSILFSVKGSTFSFHKIKTAPHGLPSVDEYRVTDWPDATRLLGPLGDQSANSMSQNVQMKLATAVPLAFKASDLP
jgi:hypothetical protein